MPSIWTFRKINTMRFNTTIYHQIDESSGMAMWAWSLYQIWIQCGASQFLILHQCAASTRMKVHRLLGVTGELVRHPRYWHFVLSFFGRIQLAWGPNAQADDWNHGSSSECPVRTRVVNLNSVNNKLKIKRIPGLSHEHRFGSHQPWLSFDANSPCS
jgi:hypothetical protein